MELSHPGALIVFKGFGQSYDDITGPDDPQFSYRILCEGDSWFSIGAIPLSNMLMHLRFTKPTLTVSLAKPGDTIRNMSEISANPVLKKLIQEKNFLTEWDAIFISGGGNDLIDAADRIICNPSAGAGQHMFDYIDRLELAKFRKTVQDGYVAIAKLRDGSKNEKTPIVAHIYDYPTPRNAKAKFVGIDFAGPWLYPAFKRDDVPEEFWISITDHIYEELVTAIYDLTTKIENFHVITETRYTLVRARLGTTGRDGDWENEIHPTTDGFRKLAEVVSTRLAYVLST